MSAERESSQASNLQPSYVVHPRQREEFLAKKPLIDRAGAEVMKLLGENPIPTEEFTKKRSGVCHICGREEKMTFEHIPPRSAGNHLPVRIASLETALSVPLGEPVSRNWISLQKGVGLYVTCQSCNNLAGRRFVGGYFDFAAKVADGVFGVVEKAKAEGRSLPKGIRMNLRDIHVGAVIRQVICMLLAVSGGFGVSERYPAFRRILDGAAEQLPPEVQIRLGIVSNGRTRISPLSCDYDLATGRYRGSIEIAHFPLAWLLEIGDRSDSKDTVEATDWTKYKLNEMARTLMVELPLGTIATPFGGDYRSVDEVEVE